MIETIKRAVEIIRNQGFPLFLNKSISYTKLHYMVYKSKIIGGYNIQISNVGIIINISSHKEAATVKYILQNEIVLINDILSELEPGDHFWDVGANVGIHTCIVGNKSDKVTSIEPYPPNIESLEKNIAKNRDVDAEILSIGLSDLSGTEKLAVPESESTGNQKPGLLPNDISEQRRSELVNSKIMEINVRTGDELIDEGIDLPNVIKIDVEGSAQKVVDGMKNILKHDDCRLIYVEVHLTSGERSRPSVEDFDHEPGKIKEDLEKLGFKICVLEEREADFFIKGKK